ncbi:MAG TPA: pitrilysin family protein [Vicinamibacterales bacterium]|nr:pitrilysin family protein [Vicinamibacterales bacterium]
MTPRPALVKRTRVIPVLAVVLVAAATAIAAQQPRADRSKPPALGPAPRLNLPPIQKRTLSNGLPVWLIEAHEVPLVQVNLLVLAGSGDDPAGKFGVASLTAAMLDEGAGARDALQLADAVEVLGASLATVSSFDASAVRLNVPAARLGDALPIMADVALRPTFSEKELDRVRKERITSLLQARDDPASVAPMAFARTVFGATHRYGTAAVGTEATLKGFTTGDLRTFHEAMYQPSNATLVAVGDIRADAVVPLLEKHFGAWKNRGAPARARVPDAPQLTSRQITIVDMPKAAQSQIRIGGVGVPRSTPDYFTLQVLNTILGGSFTSRLNQNLREEHQYSYGASSRFEMRLSAGSFVAGAGVQTDKTAEALREFFNELEAIRKPVGADELAKAKNYVALGFPSEFETISDLTSHVEELIVYKLPDDYFSRYVDSIQAVTSAAVAQAAAKYVLPQQFAVVIAGDRAAIEAGIRALNLGPVRVMSVSEALGS